MECKLINLSNNIKINSFFFIIAWLEHWTVSLASKGDWIGEIKEAKMLVNLLSSPHGNHSNRYNKISSKLKPCTILFSDWSECCFLD